MQVWELHEKGKLADAVDMSLEGDFDIEEACRFTKVGLLCTQDMPKSRPSMSTVVSMLTGEADVGDDIFRPGLIADLIGIKFGGTPKYKFDAASGSGNLGNSSSSSAMTTSIATMTFNSIFDRTG